MKKGELRELYQMMFPEYPDIVTVKELREMLGISRKLAYKLIDYGHIHAVKIGTTLKIPKISVINYVMTKRADCFYSCRSQTVYPLAMPASSERAVRFYSRQGRSAKTLVRACPKTPKEKTMKVRTTQ